MAYCLQTFGSTHLQAMLHIERFLGRIVAFPPGTPQCVVVLSGQPIFTGLAPCMFTSA